MAIGDKNKDKDFFKNRKGVSGSSLGQIGDTSGLGGIIKGQKNKSDYKPLYFIKPSGPGMTRGILGGRVGAIGGRNKTEPYASPDVLEAQMAIAAGKPTSYSSGVSDFSDEEALGYGSNPFSSVPGRGGARPIDRYASALASMIRGGRFGGGSQNATSGAEAQNKLLQDLLGQFRTQSEQEINTSTGALKSLLESQQNPYASLQARAANVAPELQQLLASQGASTDPLAQYAAATQQANQGGVDALNQLYQTLGANWQAGQQGAIGDVEAQRQDLMRGLTANTQAGQFSLQQQLAAQQQAAAQSQAALRQKYLQMLLNAASKGARVNLKGLM